ncbi:MAG: hypothetical protein ACKVGZ_07730 [Alphaproteobacteria bacterium]|jgi:hypothetical protein
MTWVNDTGALEYMKYNEDPKTPVVTVLVKESFSVNGKGKAKAGPLFIMEKAAAGKSPETNDWYYMMVAPNGTPMGINVIPACNDCHVGGFSHQGSLGYPVEEARITK